MSGASGEMTAQLEDLRLVHCDCGIDEDLYGHKFGCGFRFDGRCICAGEPGCPYCEGTMLEVIETLPIEEDDLDIMCGMGGSGDGGNAVG